MRNLDDMILYENENSGLDFKAIQYTKEKFEGLLKDVISMANAEIEGECFIIIGVKHEPNGNRQLLGVKKEEFIDAAIYQQVVRENIDPDITIDYFPHTLNNILFGILKISNFNDKPYMMKKDYGKLTRGSCYIRKGSQQLPLLRVDLDRIIEKRILSNSFSGEVKINFMGYNSNYIELQSVGDIEFPSEKAAKRIKKILTEKESMPLVDIQKNMWSDIQAKVSSSLTGILPYENRDIETLKKNLANVKETYLEDDLYELFEVNSHKINFEILNLGTKFIEDTLIIFELDSIEGLTVAKKIYHEPQQGTYFVSGLNEYNFDNLQYPEVKEEEKMFIIRNNLKNVRHGLGTPIFDVPIRIILGKQLEGKEIEIRYKLFGKNLIKPIQGRNIIKVIPKIFKENSK